MTSVRAGQLWPKVYTFRHPMSEIVRNARFVGLRFVGGADSIRCPSHGSSQRSLVVGLNVTKRPPPPPRRAFGAGVVDLGCVCFGFWLEITQTWSC